MIKPSHLITFLAWAALAACAPFHGADTDSPSNAQVSQDPSFQAARTVLLNRCVTCHSPGGAESAIPLNMGDPTAFVMAGLVTPGNLAGSRLITVLANYPGNTGVSMPPTGPISTNEYDTLTNWVASMAP